MLACLPFLGRGLTRYNVLEAVSPYSFLAISRTSYSIFGIRLLITIQLRPHSGLATLHWARPMGLKHDACVSKMDV